MSYLEMKYNLLMSYCTFLTFYLLLKVEGKPVENHPVIHKLTHILGMVRDRAMNSMDIIYKVTSELSNEVMTFDHGWP